MTESHRVDSVPALVVDPQVQALAEENQRLRALLAEWIVRSDTPHCDDCPCLRCRTERAIR